MTGWSLEYVMDGISIGALNTLLGPGKEENDKPKGLLAGNLDLAVLKEMGFEVFKD